MVIYHLFIYRKFVQRVHEKEKNKKIKNLGALALRTERQSAQMSKIINGGLDQYGAEPFKQQQLGTAGVEGVNQRLTRSSFSLTSSS